MVKITSEIILGLYYQFSYTDQYRLEMVIRVYTRKTKSVPRYLRLCFGYLKFTPNVLKLEHAAFQLRYPKGKRLTKTIEIR